MSHTLSPIRNGVDMQHLQDTLDTLSAGPELGAFTFRATNRWQRGTHSRTQIESFSGAGAVHQHVTNIGYSADHPAMLCGEDHGPTPVEFLLHALAGCVTRR